MNRPLPGGLRRFFGGTLDQIVPYANYLVAKWWRGLDWEKRSQNGESLRQKRKRDQYGRCCTFHVRRDECVTEGLPFVCSRVATLRDNILPLTRGCASALG